LTQRQPAPPPLASSSAVDRPSSDAPRPQLNCRSTCAPHHTPPQLVPTQTALLCLDASTPIRHRDAADRPRPATRRPPPSSLTNRPASHWSAPLRAPPTRHRLTPARS
jgi:hypothetical protein